MAVALLKEGQRWGLLSRGPGMGKGAPDEPTTPVAELEGRLASLELSHPNAGSSPTPARPAAQAQLKLPRLPFRAQPVPVLPSID